MLKHFSLNRKKQPGTMETDTEAERAQAIEDVSRQSVKILLAEDNLVNQKVAVKLLEDMGLSVDVAENGLETVHMASLTMYDLILMDCHMPDMDGFEAARQIRAFADEKGQIPIVALTADTLPEHHEKCLEAGMNDYLAKPVDRYLLMQMLEKWLQNFAHEAQQI